MLIVLHDFHCFYSSKAVYCLYNMHYHYPLIVIVTVTAWPFASLTKARDWRLDTI